MSTERIRRNGKPRKSGTKWTPEQLRGITTTGKSLLISAAAGSGKTSVLAERCVYLVCDAPEPCDVHDLLVVTFTEAAALSMKQRITGALQERLERGNSPRIAQQLSLVDHAQISTLHSFCMRLLREHFQHAGLDPTFHVIDADEAKLMRRELARELFDDSYELDSNGSFHRLMDGYGNGNDESLLRRVLQLHALLTSILNPKEWIADARQRIVEAASMPIEQSELGRELLLTVREGLHALHRRCGEARAHVGRLGFAGYAGYVDALAETIRYWIGALADGGLDALCEVVKDVDWKSLTLPRESGDPERRAAAKAAVEAIRQPMKGGAWRNLLKFTASQWRAGMKAIEPHANTFLNLVERFETRYSNAKRSSRVVDFADLERLSLDILRDQSAFALSPSEIARHYHRQFAHVLVDEYQDINQVQDAILRLISRECIEDSRTPGNLFCVGDVKQSIYRFRLAEPRQFLNREASFREGQRAGEVVDLQANFRSRKPLLGALNSIFSRLMTDEATEIQYDESHELRAGKEVPEDSRCFAGAPIELHVLPVQTQEEPHDEEEAAQEMDRTEREATLIAQRIGQIVAKDGSEAKYVIHDGLDGPEARPARFGDIVILLRAMRFKAGQFAQVLRRFDIPVHSQSGSGFFDSVEVRDVLALLGVMDNQRQDIPLAALLRSPLARMPEPESSLARIRLAYPAGRESVPFHEAVRRYAAEQDDALARWLGRFFGQLARWRDAAQRRPLADVLWQIYQQTGYLAFVSGLDDGAQRVANLKELHERAAQFGTFQHQGLSRFLRFLEALCEESDLGPASVTNEAQDVVRIMSVHRAKGLEFPIVFLPDLGKQINLNDCRGHILADRAGGLGMSVVDQAKQCRYPSLSHALVQERIRRQSLAEELRVLYVAATRAREHLIMIGTCSDENWKRWRADWSNHDGHLPSDVVLSARTVLDWIGPLEAMTADHAVPLFEKQPPMPPESEVPGIKWRDASLPNKLEPLARLTPLDPPPPLDARATEAIERIAFTDPFRAYGDLPAAVSVTSQKGRPDIENAKNLGSSSPHSISGAGRLELPRFLSDRAVATAIDTGIATHLVLQHLNFGGSIEPADIQNQVLAMVDRRVLTSTEASRVDVAAIKWFLNSEIGQFMRRNTPHLRREASVYFPRAWELTGKTTASNDALDQVMVRGRLDALIALADGSIIVDYKTDSIPAALVPARLEHYRPQMLAYRDAIQRITQLPVLRTCIVFFTPQIAVDL